MRLPSLTNLRYGEYPKPDAPSDYRPRGLLLMPIRNPQSAIRNRSRLLVAAVLTVLLPLATVAAVLHAAQPGPPQASAPFAIAEGAGDQLWPNAGGSLVVYA